MKIIVSFEEASKIILQSLLIAAPNDVELEILPKPRSETKEDLIDQAIDANIGGGVIDKIRAIILLRKLSENKPFLFKFGEYNLTFQKLELSQAKKMIEEGLLRRGIK